MKVLVFGASGKTGREIIKQGLEQGHFVTGFVRNTTNLSIQHPKLSITQGDLTDKRSLTAAIKGQEVIISVLGNKTASALWKSNTVISDGIKKIITEMKNQKVSRLLFVTSFGVDKEIFLPEKIIIKLFLKNIFADIPLQEKLIKESGFDWTLVHPARLVDNAKTGIYKKAEQLPIGITSHISRADVADFLIKESQQNQYIHKTVTLSY